MWKETEEWKVTLNDGQRVDSRKYSLAIKALRHAEEIGDQDLLEKLHRLSEGEQLSYENKLSRHRVETGELRKIDAAVVPLALKKEGERFTVVDPLISEEQDPNAAEHNRFALESADEDVEYHTEKLMGTLFPNRPGKNDISR